MIIGCPSCRTRYLVDEQALGGRTGRTVRCATCGHTWHQKAPPELELPDDQARRESLRIEPALEVPPRPGAVIEPNLEVSPHPGSAPEPAPRPSGGRRAAVRWLVLLVLFALAVLAGVVVARGAVALIWPPAARLYALAGFPVEPLWAGLRIEKLAPARTADGLIIEGGMANAGKIAREIPRLRVALRDAAEKKVQCKIVDPPKTLLPPGSVMHFKTPFDHPDNAATGVVVTFAMRAQHDEPPTLAGKSKCSLQ
jgi:predicted Zn finger-like uncharacterized protein